MASKLVRSCAAWGGVSSVSWVMAGPSSQAPTNMPIATAAIAAISGSARNVDTCSR